MRKGVRITAETLEKWEKKGRGQGIYGDYVPWHMISRADPASLGKSTVLPSASLGRQLHFLSGAELVGAMCMWRLPWLVDMLEQYPLSHKFSESVLSEYDHRRLYPVCSGTEAVAEELGVRHPAIPFRNGGRPPAPWVMTTDLVGVCRHGGRWGAIAVSVKFDAALSPRAQELLQIEERYWTHRGHAWRLLNCSTMPRADYHSVLAVAPSVLMFPRLAATDLEAIGSKMRAIGQQSLHAALSAIQSLHLQTATPPVSAFYQAVWSGHYPVDLGLATSRGKLRPSEHVVGEGWDPLLSEALV